MRPRHSSGGRASPGSVRRGDAMNARTWIPAAVALALLCSCSTMTSAAKGSDPLGDELRAVAAGNITAYDRKDLGGTMGYIHTQSPDYAPTKAALEEQFKTLDVKSELVDFDYVGHDDEFAVARVKSKTIGKKVDFTNNTVDAIVVFHMENGTWKLWSQQVLGVFIEP